MIGNEYSGQMNPNSTDFSQMVSSIAGAALGRPYKDTMLNKLLNMVEEALWYGAALLGGILDHCKKLMVSCEKRII